MNLKRAFFFLLLSISVASTAAAWTGFDYQNKTFIKLQKNSHLKAEETIYAYDYNLKKNRHLKIVSINHSNPGMEITVLDLDNNKESVLYMQAKH